MRRAAAALVLLAALPALADGLRLPDGRRYPGKVEDAKNGVRVTGPKRVVLLPKSAKEHTDDGPALDRREAFRLRRARGAFAREAYGEAVALLASTTLAPKLLARAQAAEAALKPIRARLRALGDAAGLAGKGELSQVAQALTVRLDARSAPVAGRVVKGLGALPTEADAIASELTRLRLAIAYGLTEADPARVAAGEAFLTKLLAAKADQRQKLLGALPELPIAVWTALIRGGAGRVEDRPPEKTVTHTVPVEGGTITYDLRVPKGYRPGAPTPLLVALHGEGDRPRSMIGAWGATAERYGWLLASAEFVVHGKRGYRHTWAEARATLATITDVASRFAVDPDRVFVSGHSLGGHATYDVALSHPDRFAGAAPVVGSAFAFDDHYRKNAVHVPIYSVQGETDPWTPRNRKHLPQLLKYGADATYVEFIGRGHSGFREEYDAIATWAEARRRTPYPRRLSLRSGRHSDLRRFWVRIDDVSARFWPQAPTDKVHKKTVVHLEARIEKRNTIRVDVKGARAVTVFLNAEMLDLTKKVRIRFNRKVRHNARVTPSAKHLLADFAERRDRGLLFSASVSVGRR